MQTSRRTFFMKLVLTGLSVLSFPSILSAINYKGYAHNIKKVKGLTFLFQGDSITDGGRSRDTDWNHIMGHGYAYLIASRLWYDYPNKDLMFYNRGVSGNKIKDLIKRWQKDTIDLNPDFITILIGVNDVPKIVAKEYSIEEWQNSYKTLLNKTKEKLPNTKLILCEPFLLPADWNNEKTESWQRVITKMQEIVRELAKDYNTMSVDFQKQFNRSCQKAPAKYWVWDGIHPMPAGHELMARIWIKEVSKKLEFIESH